LFCKFTLTTHDDEFTFDKLPKYVTPPDNNVNDNGFDLKSIVATELELPTTDPPNHTESNAVNVLAVELNVAHEPLALWYNPANEVTFVTTPPHPRVITLTEPVESVTANIEPRTEPPNTVVDNNDTLNDDVDGTVGHISFITCGPL
jgi:hypothetical protein